MVERRRSCFNGRRCGCGRGLQRFNGHAFARQRRDLGLGVGTARPGTGKIGDGKIFVTAVEQVIRIRTGEIGADAR